jgi:ribbon-helix-helix CopG family protein
MNTQLIVRIDKLKKEQFERTARKRGKTVSEVLREFIDDYIKRHDMAGYLGKLMDEIGEGFKRDGITLEDVERTIREVREEARKAQK